MEQEALEDHEREFESAKIWVSSPAAEGLSTADKLGLYGCFKQATVGDCTGSKPWGIEASYKWEAWNSQRGVPKAEAMRRYVNVLDEIAPSWREGAMEDEPTVEELLAAETVRPAEGTGMGVRASTMAAVEDDDLDETPVGQLCKEIAEGNTEAVETLLRRRPELAFQADKDGMTPLHWAADRGRTAVVKALLALAGSGADAAARVSARDGSGDTPLHYALNTENAEVARLLVAGGADVRAENEDGETPLALAEAQGLDLQASS